MLDRLPSIITIVSFGAICLAAAHEWAYFSVIGSEYQTLYTTSDYIALLIWGTGAAFFLVLVASLIQLAVYRSDNFTVPPFSKKKTFGGFMDRNFDIVMASFFFLISLLFSRSQVNFYGYALFAYITVRTLFYIFSHEKTKSYAQGWRAIPVFGLLPSLILAYCLGKTSAYEDISATHTRYELTLRSQIVSRSVNVLRFLEKGVILFDPKNRSVEFLRHEAISRLVNKMPELETRSLACKYWEIGCKRQNPT